MNLLHNTSRRSALVAAAMLGYTMLFLFAHSSMGDSVAIFSFIPGLIAAWLFGTWVGLSVTALTFFVTLGLNVVVGVPLLQLMGTAGFLPGNTANFLVVGIVGRFRDLRHRVVEELDLRRAAEAALVATNAELEAASAQLHAANAELEQFAYVASHDLSEPLRMVTSFMGLLQSRYSGQLDSDADEFINFAVEGATRMKVMIDDLLQYSRTGRSDAPFVEVNLDQELAAIIQSVSTRIEETGTQIDVGEMPTLTLDLVQSRQLFQNLITNAMKFVADGITPRVQISHQVRDGRHEFRVADNGIGIEPQYRERVFGVFKRLHGREQYEGSGIGLSICSRIVAHHGGRIWIEDGIDGGAAFVFTLLDQRQLKAA